MVVDSVEDWDTWEGPSQEDRGMEDGPYCEDEDFNVSPLDPTNETTSSHYRKCLESQNSFWYLIKNGCKTNFF